MSGTKFVLERTGTYGRIGLINEWGSDATSLQRATPTYVIYTRAGHIPHLTWDTVASKLKLKQSANLFQLTLPSQ
uniref:Uncharacterized protein n=1 Tax=Steinernema glaseri TaxID=37863 RepID=A0A1I8AAT0_9BILA